VSTATHDAPGLLNAKAAASRLGCSEALVMKLRDRGELPAVRVGDLVRFDPADVEAFIAAQREAR
jgi:excisionase family DNA binding protein